MKFWDLNASKWIEIPHSQVKFEEKDGRKIAIGYHNGRKYAKFVRK